MYYKAQKNIFHVREYRLKCVMEDFDWVFLKN